MAARPLGSEIAGAQDVPLDPKLPRDLHGELKKPTHGFLADRGTVTVAPNERALISVLLARLQRDDPDVLCGHNILGFELDVLLARALALKVGNAWSKVSDSAWFPSISQLEVASTASSRCCTACVAA